MSAKKLLIWDGDNTLWPGVISEGTAGAIPQERINLCQRLAGMGVLQSVCSRNLLQDVEEKLHQAGLSDRFLGIQADFTKSKSQMISEVMSELGLVKYSNVLFIDDDEYNCLEVRSTLGAEAYSSMTDQEILAAFAKDHYTEEDLDRVAMYRSEIARKKSGQSFPGPKIEFLRSCGMQAVVRQPTTEDLPRIMDLVSRANQTAACYGDCSQEKMAEDLEAGRLYVMACKDKFGSYGLSAVCRVEEGCITVFVVSCRLQGKGYGSAFLGTMINRFGSISARWLATEYNVEVENLYKWYGFDITKEGNVCTAALRTTGVSLPNWIFITRGS